MFIVNVDWFFDSHRRPLEKRLSKDYHTSIVAGDSGYATEYSMEKFSVSARVPTIKGIKQLYLTVRKFSKDTIFVVVSPVMIIVCHFLFRKRSFIIYNFSGLGFLRSKSRLIRGLILQSFLNYPVKGTRVIVVQNKDDFNYFDELARDKDHIHTEIIAGSGFEKKQVHQDSLDISRLVIGYVGRVRKDKGILDLVRAVTDLQNAGYSINLKIWGNLDDSTRHGFSESELEELKSQSHYFQGFSKDKREIFSSFNWFCLPSNGEGLSKAAIEASSFGLPLLLSNVQGNRDMIKDNGFLFEYGDVENLKRVLVDISNLSKEEVQNMSETSKSMFEVNWTLESVYNKWKQLLVKYDTFSA